MSLALHLVHHYPVIVKSITNASSTALELLDAQVVQAMLRVDRSTVYRMAEDGRLPAIKVGRQWRFPASAIDRWLHEQGLNQVAPVAVALTPPAQPAPLLPSAAPLAELLPLACVQLILDTFAETAGAMMILTDMDGRPITRVSNPCGLMVALQDAPDLWAQCGAHWRRMAGALELEPRFEAGPLDLLCARGLVRAGAELKGMVFAGGFAPEGWPPAAGRVAELAGQLRVDEERLAVHLTEVHYLDPARRAATLLLVQRVANIVSHIISERSRPATETAAQGEQQL